ncbi:MAG: sulfurtransferase [Chloroflexi bacterium]|nr:sulfurtransferase [Chloroflexota bacterium]
MPLPTLISTTELAEHLSDPDYAIIDCRFDLLKPEWGEAEYSRAHIPGALYAHLDRDLSGAITPTSGRHPLPRAEDFIARCSAWGINARTQVVAYDAGNAAYAARLWWLLRFYGHAAVAVLDGGFAQWSREQRATRSEFETRARAEFRGEPRAEMLADAREVERVRADAAYRVIDARLRPRFTGAQEPIDPVAGHIPGAVNRPYDKNISSEGVFRAPAELRDEFSELLGNARPQNAITYCGSGVTACQILLALEHAGLPGARLYAGSWSEWIREPARAVATGE